MAVILGKEVEVGLTTEEGDVVKAFFLPLGHPKTKEVINDLGNMDFPDDEKARAQESYRVLVKVFDELCVRVENIDDYNEAGEALPLTPENFPDWRERLWTEWKFMWALEFRARTRLSLQQRGNSNGQSSQDTN